MATGWWRPRTVSDLLGTPWGDKALTHPEGPDRLYRELVGDPVPEHKPRSIEHKAPPTRVGSSRLSQEDFYSSRDYDPGVGYPSCSRAVARKPRSFSDANRYYARIGVATTATDAEIRRALRNKYRRCHPDGWAPDSEEFSYLREIAAVLLNPDRRERYDNLRPGEKWLDSRVAAELKKNHVFEMGGVNIRSMFDTPMARSRDDVVLDPITPFVNGLAPVDESELLGPTMIFYDYFADQRCFGDRDHAQRWYAALVAVAPLAGYTRSIRVWLVDADEPQWIETGGILRIPRWWPVGTAEAFALFTVSVGVSRGPVGRRCYGDRATGPLPLPGT